MYRFIERAFNCFVFNSDRNESHYRSPGISLKKCLIVEKMTFQLFRNGRARLCGYLNNCSLIFRKFPVNARLFCFSEELFGIQTNEKTDKVASSIRREFFYY